jgi:hypothetical protein
MLSAARTWCDWLRLKTLADRWGDLVRPLTTLFCSVDGTCCAFYCPMCGMARTILLSLRRSPWLKLLWIYSTEFLGDLNFGFPTIFYVESWYYPGPGVAYESSICVSFLVRSQSYWAEKEPNGTFPILKLSLFFVCEWSYWAGEGPLPDLTSQLGSFFYLLSITVMLNFIYYIK